MISLKRLKVLLIEGEKDSAQYIINLLKDLECIDFNIVHKKTMADSLECIEYEKDIDIILMDLILPNSSGVHAFETIKDMKNCENIPIIVISDDKEIGIEVIRMGAQDFIPKKNLTLDQLVRSMRYAIERKKNELELKKTQERLRMALDSTSDGIWDYDIKNNHIYFSNRYEELLGYKSGSLTGSIENLLDIMHPDDRERIIKQNIMFLNNKEESSYKYNIYKDEIRLKDFENNYRWFLIRSMCVAISDNIPSRLVGVVVDVTSRKESEKIREESFDNLSFKLEEKLKNWNEEFIVKRKEQEEKLNKLTNGISELISIR